MDVFSLLLVGVAAIGGGAVNALAGGGTLITFPALMLAGASSGVTAVMANVTNTVALLPGYLGATYAQKDDLKGQSGRMLIFLPIGALGGILGGILLLNTGEKLFSDLVPYLILLASGLLALQNPVRNWMTKRTAAAALQGGGAAATPSELWKTLPVGLAAIYGGYFGAGLSVIVLAVLGLVLDDTLTRLNALKQAISFSVNLAAAIFFLFSGKVVWEPAMVMAVGALIGGVLGGKLAGRIQPSTLRWVVVTIGVIVAVIYLVR